MLISSFTKQSVGIHELWLINKGKKYTLTKRRISLNYFAIVQFNFVLHSEVQLITANHYLTLIHMSTVGLHCKGNIFSYVSK